jgi:hypothetical protein
MGSPSGSSKGKEHQCLQLSRRRSRKQSISFMDTNIVVGDLRDPNILYVASKGDGEGCVVLVDLDWSAKDEEGRYPAALNPNNSWCEDVQPYGIMRKSHDLWQLDRLKALCGSAA